MKTSNIFYMMCATALFSSCHIYKAYDRPEDINADGIYRDPISLTDTLAVTDTTNMGNVPWKEMFTDPKLQALIEEGLANNVDMQAAILRVEEARVMLTSARLSFWLRKGLQLPWTVAVLLRPIHFLLQPAGR